MPIARIEHQFGGRPESTSGSAVEGDSVLERDESEAVLLSKCHAKDKSRRVVKRKVRAECTFGAQFLLRVW